MDISKVLKALSDDSRMKIITLLLSRSSCGKGLAKKIGISEAAVSQHIGILKQAGLLYGEKRGYRMHYSVNRDMLREVSEYFSSLAETIHEEVCRTGQCSCENEKNNKKEGMENEEKCTS